MLRQILFALLLTVLVASPATAQRIPPAFGLNEMHGRDLRVFFKWAEVLSRMRSGSAVPAPFAQHPELAGLDFVRQVMAVNDIVNAYPHVSDDDNWGQSDYWETPVEFFARGGDCEDYAIAKYAWLRFLGVPENRLRIAMVYDRQKEEEHMILVAYTEGGKPLYLDSQIKQLRARNDFARYWPLYSVNRDGWWIVTQQGQGKKILDSLLANAASGAN
jgi:predicted transglutaminase-like cysteine proteinase